MSVAVRLRPAEAADAAALSELALRSKGHWGYGAELLDACADELTVRPAHVTAYRVVVAERAGWTVGFSLLADPSDADGDVAELAMLFVDPVAIGTGAGGALLRDALAAATRPVLVESDPNAESFYLAHGFRRIGSRRSPSTGRDLPLLRFSAP